MGKFKVGDRVRYVGNTEGKTQDDRAIGNVGIVTGEGWSGADYQVAWDGGSWAATKPYAHNLEPEVKTFEGIKEGDRVRFEANTRDYAYGTGANGLPTAYNGIEGTVTRDGYFDVTHVEWDITEIGNRAAFKQNLVVIDRPAPKTHKVTVEFEVEDGEDIVAILDRTDIDYAIKEDK